MKQIEFKKVIKPYPWVEIKKRWGELTEKQRAFCVKFELSVGLPSRRCY